MASRPYVVAFDIIETTFALDSLRSRLSARGLPESVLDLWFAHTLRDAFALATASIFVPFSDVATETVRALCTRHSIKPDQEKDKAVVLGFSELDPQPEAKPALEAAKAAGFRIVALSNGADHATNALLRRSGLSRFFERVISVGDIQRWKPLPDIYRHAVSVAGVAPEEMALVAVHAWDVNGAKSAGLTAGFVARGQPFPAVMAKPDVMADTLPEVIDRLARLPTH